jgi:polysaccharide biosynthesis transport protein
MNIDFRFYLIRFLHRIHYFLLVVFAVSAIGLTLAYILPPVYRAQAQLLVEAPQIPDELAPTTVRNAAPEVLQIIKQRLTTREKLLEMADRYQIYAGLPPMSPDKILADMRERTTMQLPSSGDSASFVTVSFAAETGELSARVTNEFVQAILKESTALRTESAGQTLEFFTSEVAQLNNLLAQQGAKILEFKQTNKDALPDSLDYRRTRQTSLQERLLQMDRDLSALGDRRARLVELYERTGQIEPVTDARTAEERQLQQLQDDLQAALAVYSEQNPRVKTLQAQIDALQKVVSTQLARVNPETQGLSDYEVQLADIDGQADFIRDQQQEIETELAALQLTIDATPKNAITLDVLQRDYDNTQLQYNTAVARLSQAATGDRIETLSKGQRISVVEEAIVPNSPASPPRRLIALGSGAAGVGLGLALVILLELLNRAIKRPADLVAGIGITPFANIPYFYTRKEIWRHRGMILLAFLLVLAGVALLLFLIHIYFRPLDSLFGPLFAQLIAPHPPATVEILSA